MGLCSSSVDPGEEGGLQLDANGKPVFKQTMKQKKQVEVDVFPEESWCDGDGFLDTDEYSGDDVPPDEPVEDMGDEELGKLMPLRMMRSPRQTSMRTRMGKPAPANKTQYGDRAAQQYADWARFRRRVVGTKEMAPGAVLLWDPEVACVKCGSGGRAAVKVCWPCGHNCLCDECINIHCIVIGSECPLCDTTIKVITDADAEGTARYWRDEAKTSVPVSSAFRTNWGLSKLTKEAKLANGRKVRYRATPPGSGVQAPVAGKSADDVNARILAQRRAAGKTRPAMQQAKFQSQKGKPQFVFANESSDLSFAMQAQQTFSTGYDALLTAMDGSKHLVSICKVYPVVGNDPVYDVMYAGSEVVETRVQHHQLQLATEEDVEAMKAAAWAAAGAEVETDSQVVKDFIEDDEDMEIVQAFQGPGTTGGTEGNGEEQPTGWHELTDEQGQTYFYNYDTGESSWERPGAGSPSD